MFPGQGSQYVGMGKALLENFPSAKQVFEEAEDATKINIRKLCFDGPEDELTLTANTQPCILTVSVATWKVLKAETGLTPQFYAGHSLGEYSANVAAEKLSLYNAAFLVRKRGEAMQEAVPAGVGAMAAILKCPESRLETECKAASIGGKSVQVVNYNTEEQLVIAGHREAVDNVCKTLSAEQIRCVPLPVSAPFHSSLMEPARKKMDILLNATEFNQNPNKIIANLTGKVEINYGRDHLIKQVDSPVYWTQSVKTAVENDVKTFIEIGPGKVLFGLLRRSLPRGEHKVITTDSEIKAAIQSIQA
jgi:[acyl-carrier-protein] S-malonyltransferase